jgi:hypothetical protein
VPVVDRARCRRRAANSRWRHSQGCAFNWAEQVGGHWGGGGRGGIVVLWLGGAAEFRIGDSLVMASGVMAVMPSRDSRLLRRRTLGSVLPGATGRTLDRTTSKAVSHCSFQSRLSPSSSVPVDSMRQQPSDLFTACLHAGSRCQSPPRRMPWPPLWRWHQGVKRHRKERVAQS